MSKKLNKKALAATGLALALSIGATQLPQTQVVFHAPFQAKRLHDPHPIRPGQFLQDERP